ncbi:MAG TPA: DNA replication/repair protein RecF [Clostridiales bacterium]|nr:DNA replication/repair protein RecF [Clostridiales bacterium]
MTVKRLTAHNFRNLKEIELEADSGVNIIYGQNAQGKTNLLECIWLFTGAKSFRGAKDTELVSFGCESAHIAMDFTAHGREQTARIIFTPRRQAELNGIKLALPSKLAGEFYAVIFSPDHLSLIKDGPSERRRFLDLAIGQLWPGYIEVLRQYNRAVSQRNLLLKKARERAADCNTLEAFEREIARSGAVIMNYRSRYIEILNSTAPEIYHNISGKKERLSIEYVRKEGLFTESDLAEALESRRQQDILSGTTSVGPHRDDLEFEISGTKAGKYGSQGQQRSVVLALKLAEAQIIKQITGEQPVALLDDVMSELDTVRQDYILNHIKGWQVLITCCDPSPITKLINGKVFYMQGGRLCEG